MLVPTNVVVREEVIAAIQEMAAQLNRAPSFVEVTGKVKVSAKKMRLMFGTWASALQQSGIAPPRSGGAPLTMQELFEDWAAVVRTIKKVPSLFEFERHSQHSRRPLLDRVKSWRSLGQAMWDFAEQRDAWAGWEDVKLLVREHLDRRQQAVSTCKPKPAQTCTAPVPRPAEFASTGAVYGRPLYKVGMITAPVNEDGVLMLFGMMAVQLGFLVLRVQKGFPDVEALRQVSKDHSELQRIEVEFLSRNFLDHGHDPKKCDLIVCWINNWPECPVEVVELSKLVEMK